MGWSWGELSAEVGKLLCDGLRQEAENLAQAAEKRIPAAPSEQESVARPFPVTGERQYCGPSLKERRAEVNRAKNEQLLAEHPEIVETKALLEQAKGRKSRPVSMVYLAAKASERLKGMTADESQRK